MEEEKPTKEKTVKNNDRISQLPDNLIGIILSNLTIREAVSTSLLSTRWKYLWTTSLSNLEFDVDNMLHTKDTFGHLQVLIILPKKKRLNFLHSVDQFLLHLSSDHKINKIKVDQWISFAISRGVEELDLSLLENGYFGAVEDDADTSMIFFAITSGRGLIPSLKCLRLASKFIGFNVDLKSDEHVKILLSSSFALEWLSLYCSCYFELRKATREINRPPRCPHDHLREVVMTGTRGLSSEMEIAIYLLNNAIALDKMTIDPHQRYYNGDGKWNVSKACDERIPIARQRIIERLMGDIGLLAVTVASQENRRRHL